MDGNGTTKTGAPWPCFIRMASLSFFYEHPKHPISKAPKRPIFGANPRNSRRSNWPLWYKAETCMFKLVGAQLGLMTMWPPIATIPVPNSQVLKNWLTAALWTNKLSIEKVIPLTFEHGHIWNHLVLCKQFTCEAPRFTWDAPAVHPARPFLKPEPAVGRRAQTWWTQPYKKWIIQIFRAS